MYCFSIKVTPAPLSLEHQMDFTLKRVGTCSAELRISGRWENNTNFCEKRAVDEGGEDAGVCSAVLLTPVLQLSPRSACLSAPSCQFRSYMYTIHHARKCAQSTHIHTRTHTQVVFGFHCKDQRQNLIPMFLRACFASIDFSSKKGTIHTNQHHCFIKRPRFSQMTTFLLLSLGRFDVYEGY